jgi:hypothetical protein
MTADGRKRATIKSATSTLRMLNRHVNLMNPEAVKIFISKMKKKNGEPVEDSTKNKRAWDYEYFVKYNNLTYHKLR